MLKPLARDIELADLVENGCVIVNDVVRIWFGSDFVIER